MEAWLKIGCPPIVLHAPFGIHFGGFTNSFFGATPRNPNHLQSRSRTKSHLM
jgi:hypothetical protein